MGMTDRQFDSYQARLLEHLKIALNETPNNVTLKNLIDQLEAELRRP